MGLQWNVNLEFRFVLVKLIGVTVTYGRGRREHQRTNLDEAHSGTPGKRSSIGRGELLHSSLFETLAIFRPWLVEDPRANGGRNSLKIWKVLPNTISHLELHYVTKKCFPRRHGDD
jgi:hypothetical protein